MSSRNYPDQFREMTSAEFAEAQRVTENSGQIYGVQTRDEAGRVITRFHGDAAAWMAPYSLSGAPCRLNVRNR